LQKLIIAFALIVAVSCDVSHVVQGDGWFKDASGYHYTVPETRFTEEVAVEEVIAADVPAVEEPIAADEVVEPIIGSDEPVVVEIAPEVPAEPVIVEEIITADEPTPVEAVVPEVAEEVVADVVAEVPEAPVSNLREYLPPVAPADAKKKRQVPVKRVIRKVYRRFVPVKRH
jgi:hypothetical protein